ncbi:structural maintenance of chromosomes flexible hinge domain-containing protein 1-like protein, partial [Leptotrombidium deliense]
MSGEINISDFWDGENKSPTVFKLTQSFDELQKAIYNKLWNGKSRQFVLITSDREEISEKNFHKAQAGDNFFIVKSQNQAVDFQFSETVTFEPHYDVLVKSGQYEYYASRGCQPFPFAVAELIDNSLGATADNGKEGKNIEIRFYLDDDKPQNSVIAVIDNGSGMKSQDLVNWAKYKYSKFNRQNRDFSTPRKAKKNETQMCPKFLNSEISYFGAGGKQAVFFMGTAVRMISKHKQSKEVHEFLLSDELFKEKEAKKEKIFEGKIVSRQPGDESHISDSSSIGEIQRHIIKEEKNKSNFTCVVVTNIQPNHVKYLRSDFNSQYNVPNKKRTNAANWTQPIVKIKLRDVVTDNQTRFIRNSKSTFEFKADVGNAVVEGILRYHPFLYDEETYPADSFN